MYRIGERVFTHDDQLWFARSSGDFNPIHVDPIAARRLMTGRPIVHGVHLLAVAMELWRNDGARPVSVACTFNNPVSVGDEVVFTQSDGLGGEFALEATVRGRLCAQIIISTADTRVATTAGSVTDSLMSRNVSSELDEPLEEDPQVHVGARYSVAIRHADLSDRFPLATSRLGPRPLAATFALSYFVGMICPGLHSLFSSLSFTIPAGVSDDESLDFTVEKYNAGYSLFDISLDGCMQGRIKAFRRPRPQEQPSLEELSRHVGADEFRGTRSLIVGGSRGLGELTAKLLAAGGGDVVITYATGLADAMRVRDEIRVAGRGACEIMRIDVTHDAFDVDAVDCGSLDAVYFFATPTIFKTRAALFDSDLFRELCEIYLARFHDLCAALEAAAGTKKIKVYFPSTVYVAERPQGMLEYSMAKLAAEVLIGDINRSFKHVSVVSSRLPRLKTDQTSSIVKGTMPSSIETLLPIVRTMQTGDLGA